jgi:hypothetical protein
VPTKTIILGAIAAVALATVTVNAASRPSHPLQGSLVSLVAASTIVAKTDREAASISTASHEESSEAAEKPVVGAPAAPKLTVSAACQDAINNLKALHQADIAEDAAERAAAAQHPPTASSIAADKAEDAAERAQWRAALLAARTACLPQPSASCQAAIAALQALKADTLEDWRQWTDWRNVNWQAQFASLRTAVAAVATACGHRD